MMSNPFSSIARLAAERGLELIRRKGDANGLKRQLTGALAEAAKAEDRSDAPVDAIDALRDALQAGFDDAPAVPVVDLARELVPDVASARVKQLPPMPTAEAMAVTAERLRAVLREEAKLGVAPLPERAGVTMPAASVVLPGQRRVLSDPSPE